MSPTDHRSSSLDLPSAVLRKERAPWVVWLLPCAALLVAGFLAFQSWSRRGVTVTIELDEGHGLRTGDSVQYRGIAVGTVDGVEMSADLDGIVVSARLFGNAHTLACAGTRFWIVRPQLGLSGIAGLDTIIGPRYLAILPGDGAPQRTFVGLPFPPAVEATLPSDLEIILEAPRRGGLLPGAPVLYRQVRIGTVLSVALASDGGSVEARTHVQGRYAPLVREGSRFWRIGGLSMHLGVTGVTVEFESVETLLAGGVEIATPSEAGGIVKTGHRFPLEVERPKDAYHWEPFASLGAVADEASPPIVPARATLRWEQGLIFHSQRSRQGWLLQTERGLLGPSDLLTAPEKAEDGSVLLEVAGQEVTLSTEAVWSDGRLRCVAARVHERLVQSTRLRAAEAPEDCLLIGDVGAEPLPMSAARLIAEEGLWKIDPAVPIDESMHGACAVALVDGRVVGILLCLEDDPRIALLPGSF